MSQKAKILLVEDNLDNLNLLSCMLSTLGFRVSSANSAQDALDFVFQGKEFDLVLSDVSMPFMDGFEFLTKLKTIGFKQPVIAITAHIHDQLIQDCIDAGFVEVITKPVSMVTLKQCVDKLMNSSDEFSQVRF